MKVGQAVNVRITRPFNLQGTDNVPGVIEKITEKTVTVFISWSTKWEFDRQTGRRSVFGDRYTLEA